MNDIHTSGTMRTAHASRSHFTTALLVAFAACTAAHAQQPPNPTASDGAHNTAGGTDALLNLVLPAGYNTAFGDSALYSNTNGAFNAAFGGNALKQNTTGSYNTGLGQAALLGNSTGRYNTAVGAYAMYAGSPGGEDNVAVGVEALWSNSSGNHNVGVGSGSLHDLTSGYDNTAIGHGALQAATAGNGSVAIGSGALSAATGSGNIGVGSNAGSAITTGASNIDIGHPGVAGDSQTIRIGKTGGSRDAQTRAFVAGIYGATITGGATVLIDSSGQLGTVVSSGRFKKDVADMGDSSSRLMELRPVTFHYKADPSQARQYGLIAEEVAKVYPDLVVRNENGEIDSVAYHELAPMLLNELQKQHREIEALRKARERDVALLGEMRAMLKEQAAVLTRLQATPAESLRVAAR
jgi:hypothetical protein